MKRLFIYVYLYMLVMFLAVNFIVSPVFFGMVEDYFPFEADSYRRDQFRGDFHLIESNLEGLPVEQWGRAVEDLQRHFAYPIVIKPLETGTRLEAEAHALRAGEIVVHGIDENLEHRIGRSDLVLSVGPLPKPEEYIPDLKFKVRLINTLFCALNIILFIAFALIWSWPFARNLDRIGTAATALGRGALDTRVTLSKRSSLFSLAEAFNSMADRIQQLIASHKELTHTVSHELRTPLARIRFNMEIMGTTAERTERDKHHNEIRRNVDELDMLVSELLTYARFDPHNYRPPTELVELGPWLRAFIASYNDEDNCIPIDYRINSPEAGVPALVNLRMLERAISNLLHNAARHCRRRIHVTLETVDSHCLIHVDDDGHGVAEPDRKKIFKPFVRLEHTEKTEAQGYGLGLAIVQRVARWHGGRATVGSAPIGGARFTLRWPNPV